MNYMDIQTFLTIASSSSLSKAAEMLYISQPALSHRLSALEKELGTELIVRRKGVRSIELTEAGKRFLPIAKRWEQFWKETENIKLEQSSVPFHIANVDSLNLFFMPQVLSNFLRDNPGCRLNLVTMRSNVAYKAVENGEVDLGLISNPHFFKKVRTIPLFHEKLTFICAQNAKYEDTLLPSELNTTDEIYIPWSNTFLMWHDYWFGSNPDIKVALDNMALLEQLFKLKDAWAIVPSTVAQILSRKGEYRTVQMKNAPDPRTCYVIFNDQRKMNPVLEKFIGELRKTAAGFSEISVYPFENR